MAEIIPSPPASAPESTLSAVQRENKRLQEEIQSLMMHNTKLQRELMALNASREQIVADGHECVTALTDELKQVDTELTMLRTDCDRIISVICQHKENAHLRSLGDMVSDIAADSIEEEDFQSDHSTASTASTSSFHSHQGGDWKSRSDTNYSSRGRPPLSNGKKMSVDIDAERVPHLARSASAVPSSTMRNMAAAHAKTTPATATAPSTQVPSGAARDTIMSRISRSVKKTHSMPSLDRPSVQHTLGNSHSPMLTYKANAVLRATQTHLNNFRRHSGPYRRNRDTVVL